MGFFISKIRDKKQLLSLTLDENGTSVKKIEQWLQSEYGRLREVIQWVDGSIYVTTSNRDGRGNIHSGDDKILRLIPK